jgi:hypothetical protein
MNIDFLAGCLCGAFLIPALVRLVSTGRIDGWSRAPRRMPPVGETVLAWMPGANLTAVTYNGPNGGGTIPATAELYWRPMPPLPSRARLKP